MILPAGQSQTILNYDFTFEIIKDIELTEYSRALIIAGDNGVGKTTLIEKIIIPKFQSAKISFFYIGQDFAIQSHSLHASIAILLKEGTKNDPFILAKKVLSMVNKPTILICDEFDKLCSHKELKVLFQNKHIRSTMIITHNISRAIKPIKEFYTNGYRLDIKKDRYIRKKRVITSKKLW